jgi:hypothetical protein
MGGCDICTVLATTLSLLAVMHFARPARVAGDNWLGPPLPNLFLFPHLTCQLRSRRSIDVFDM